MSENISGETPLQRLQRVKQSPVRAADAIGPQMLTYFKQSVRKQTTKMAKIAELWLLLVPEFLSEHCVLEGLSRGTLNVLVDSAPHLYELKQLLLAGLQQQLLLAGKSTGLRKIVLKRGHWREAPRGAG